MTTNTTTDGTPSRAAKKRWRRRLSRAAWSKNTGRMLGPLGATEWEIWDGDRVIRAPWAGRSRYFPCECGYGCTAFNGCRTP